MRRVYPANNMKKHKYSTHSACSCACICNYYVHVDGAIIIEYQVILISGIPTFLRF